MIFFKYADMEVFLSAISKLENGFQTMGQKINAAANNLDWSIPDKAKFDEAVQQAKKIHKGCADQIEDLKQFISRVISEFHAAESSLVNMLEVRSSGWTNIPVVNTEPGNFISASSVFNIKSMMNSQIAPLMDHYFTPLNGAQLDKELIAIQAKPSSPDHISYSANADHIAESWDWGNIHYPQELKYRIGLMSNQSPSPNNSASA